MKVEVFVLTGRCGTELLGTTVRTEKSELQAVMKQEFKSAKTDLDGKFMKTGTYCGKNDASIVTDGDWYEWCISTHNIDVKDGCKNGQRGK